MYVSAVSRGDMGGRRPEKRTTRPCAEQGRKQAPSATKNEGRGGCGCDVVTYVRKQIHTYIRTPKQASSARNNDVEAVAAAKWSRTWVIYTRYAPNIYVYTHYGVYYFFLCAEQGRKQAPSATKQKKTKTKSRG